MMGGRGHFLLCVGILQLASIIVPLNGYHASRKSLKELVSNTDGYLNRAAARIKNGRFLQGAVMDLLRSEADIADVLVEVEKMPVPLHTKEIGNLVESYSSKIHVALKKVIDGVATQKTLQPPRKVFETLEKLLEKARLVTPVRSWFGK